MITLYGRENSSNVQRVLWALDELGLDYAHRRVGGSFGGAADDPAYRAMNPTGLVPTLEDEGLVLWESEAILRYLAARYGAGGPLWPDAPADRVRADAWLSWLAVNMTPAIGAVFYRTVRAPRAERDPVALAPHVETLSERFRFLDAALAERPYLSGDAFGLADIPAGVFVYRYSKMPIDRPDLPHLELWRARLAERAAYQAHLAARPLGTCLEEWRELERALGA